MGVPVIGDLDGEDDDEVAAGAGLDDEDEDELGLDGIDAEQLRQMMSDPRYAALFAAHCNSISYPY